MPPFSLFDFLVATLTFLDTHQAIVWVLVGAAIGILVRGLQQWARTRRELQAQRDELRRLTTSGMTALDQARRDLQQRVS